jgi:hypothetical protein
MSGDFLNRTYKSYKTYKNQGFSYLFALFAIVLMGLSMMGANKQWKTMMQREREAELLFRGHQYRRAISMYGKDRVGIEKFPLRVEDLLKDPKTSKRHLRTGYLDPITGGPFHAVPCKDRIKGVVSSSDGIPLKHDNFPAEYEQFRSAGTYKDWVFQYETQPIQPGKPGQPAQANASIPC